MPFPSSSSLARLIEAPVRPGTVEWIGVRPARAASMRTLGAAELVVGKGIVGDRYGNAGGARQVTLVAAESLAAIASHLGVAAVAPEALRRNVVVRGINLVALKGRCFRIGAAVLEASRGVPPVLAHRGEPRHRRLQRSARSRRHHGAGRRGWRRPHRRSRRAGADVTPQQLSFIDSTRPPKPSCSVSDGSRLPGVKPTQRADRNCFS